MLYFRVFLFVTLFSTITLALNAQPCFERTFGGVLNETASLVRPTLDHGYVLIGSRDDTSTQTRAYYVLKLDSLGNEQWSKSYGDAFDQQGSSIVQTPDSGYAFVGSHNAALYNAVAEVVRISSDGALLNSRTYPPFDGWGTQGIGIIATADSNLAISTYTDGFISQNYYSLTKLNPDLSSSWSNFVSFNGSIMNEHDAAQVNDNRFITLGHYADFFYTSPSILNVTEVRQINENGVLLLDTLYTWNSVSNSISPTRDGGMIICGERDTLGNKNIALTLLDSAGTLMWQKELGSTRNESGRQARQTKDGGFVILGSVPHPYFPLLNDILLMKVSSQGDSLWTRKFGATYDDNPIHLQETYDGGFIILGRTSSFDSSQIYLIKTDSMGVIASPYTISGPGNYFCEDDSVELVLNPALPIGSSVEWSNLQTIDSIIVSSSGNYTATVTDTNGITYRTPNYFLFFATHADANLGLSDTVGICSGSLIENLAPARLSFSYSWQLDDSLLSQVTTNYIQPTRTGKYALQVENYCGSDADTLFLDSLYSLPIAPTLNITGNKFICIDDTLPLFVPDSGWSCQWWYSQTGNAQPIIGANDTLLLAFLEGVYYVEVTDSRTCKSNSAPLNIITDNYPAYVNTSGPLSFCQGGHVILSTPQGSDIMWNTGDTTNSILIGSNGDFWYSMTSMFGCPKFSDTVSTEVYLKPYINLGPDTTVCTSDTFVINAGPGYSSYLWQDGSSNPVFLSIAQSAGLDTGLYYIDVSDVNACTNRDTLIVYFDICQEIIPVNQISNQFNVFPNLITTGAAFQVENLSKGSAEFHLFNSIGKTVLIGELQTGMTSFQAGKMPAGMYFYYISDGQTNLATGKLLIE
ncbi:MAG: T9SS type A sorting domain-containing protein [Bacteroidia bacterium]|nr:T9SS type A sorting domain-containing protein [Bacteroidia bacterium]